jgi:hypothetical protein
MKTGLESKKNNNFILPEGKLKVILLAFDIQHFSNPSQIKNAADRIH